MRIIPRTFESHRAEAMRKLGARTSSECYVNEWMSAARRGGTVVDLGELGTMVITQRGGVLASCS